MSTALAETEVANRIGAERARLAAELTRRQFAADPRLQERYGAAGRARCLEDAEFHLRYLVQALTLGQAQLFSDYVQWAASMLASRGIPLSDLQRNLALLEALLHEELPGAQAVLRPVLATALQSLSPRDPQLAPAAALAAPAQRYLEAALRRGPEAAMAVVDELMAAGMSVRELYLHVLQAAQHEVGRLWQANRISVADEHFCTAITQRVISKLYATIFQPRAPGSPVVVGACVAGELHELGARMVCDLLELDGYDTHYLGANMPAASIVEFASSRGARVLALSASTTPQLGQVVEAVGLVRRDARCSEMKVLVGGSAFNLLPSLWRLVGADGWSPDAASAGAEVKRLTA